MFDVMRSRWFYLSSKILIGKHPLTEDLILVLRDGNDLPVEVGKVLHLNKMEICGKVRVEDDLRYYPLKEKEDVHTAISS
jgi:hypothetical protein